MERQREFGLIGLFGKVVARFVLFISNKMREGPIRRWCGSTENGLGKYRTLVEMMIAVGRLIKRGIKPGCECIKGQLLRHIEPKYLNIYSMFHIQMNRLLI